MLKHLSCLGLLACLGGLPAHAQVMAGASFPVKPWYVTMKPACAKSGETAEQQFREADRLWERMPELGDTEALYVCTLEAALGGYAAAETRLGELYVYDREMAIGHIPPVHRDEDAALHWFRKAADDGDARGAFMAGQLYAIGEGAPQDDTQAAVYYARAIAGGYKPASAALEKLKTRDARIAAFEARYAAKAAGGDATAMMAYANACLAGEPLRYDPARGADWARKAAETGSADAQSLMGELSVRGLGVSHDLDAAVAWLIKAADGNVHRRDYYLTWLHDEADVSAGSRAAIEAASARGVLRELMRPSERLKIVAATAPDASGRVTVDMSGLSVADVTRLADSGVVDADVNLGLRYLDGNGVPADRAAAKRWFERAAFQNADADMNLGDMAYTDTPPDVRGAAEAYAVAGLMGDAVGARNAVKLYRQLGEQVKAYAAALSVDQLDMLPATADVKALDAVMSFEDRARGLLYLNEQKRIHYKSFKY
ncbi:hypothetical protein [Asticcacaulis solisilvae]|uniref:hypothetical protein n=1 Tax=Asticcacaulis solisilvae TaxID=1217274 RepID=UPI003FD7C983